MRKSVVEAAALASLLLGAALASCQPAGAPPVATLEVPEVKNPPAKSKLEEMIEKALKDNPDLRLAQAKFAEAEAELNRARLLVVQNVAMQYHAIEAQKAAVQAAAAELDRMRQLAKQAGAAAGEIENAEQKLIDAKAKLASLEAEMPYLLGQQAEGTFGVDVGAGVRIRIPRLDATPPVRGDPEMLRRWYLDVYGRLPTAEEVAAGAAPKPSIQGPTADRIRAALDKRFEYKCDGKSVPLRTILKEMNDRFQDDDGAVGLVIKDNLPEGDAISVDFYGMPLGAALELIEDATGCRVAVRDYGLVISPKDKLPPGAPSLHDFWKGAKAGDKDVAKEPPAKSPAEAVEGRVKEVGPNGLVRITIGSDAGLTTGNMLEVYRLNAQVPDQSKYLGRLKIVEVTAGEAVGQPVNKLTDAVQPGDHVSTRLTGD